MFSYILRCFSNHFLFWTLMSSHSSDPDFVAFLLNLQSGVFSWYVTLSHLSHVISFTCLVFLHLVSGYLCDVTWYAVWLCFHSPCISVLVLCLSFTAHVNMGISPDNLGPMPCLCYTPCNPVLCSLLACHASWPLNHPIRKAVVAHLIVTSVWDCWRHAWCTFGSLED